MYHSLPVTAAAQFPFYIEQEIEIIQYVHQKYTHVLCASL